MCFTPSHSENIVIGVNNVIGVISVFTVNTSNDVIRDITMINANTVITGNDTLWIICAG